MNTELNSIKGKKVLVIGDVMLDTYHIANISCIVFPLWSLPSRLTTYGEQPSPNRFLATLAAPPNTL